MTAKNEKRNEVSTMGNNLAEVKKNLSPAERAEMQRQKAARFGEIAKTCSEAYLDACAANDLSASLIAGQAMTRLEAAFDADVLDMIRPLMNTQNGFKTDRGPGTNKPPYADKVLAESCLSAALRGLQYVGNQFNIIAGQCYTTREGYEYLIKRFPGFQWIKPNVGTAKTLEGGYVIPMSAEWSVHGIKDSMEAEIQVRKDNYSTIDQAIGKAHRKFFKRVYERITGRTDYSPEEPEGPTLENEATQDAQEVRATETAKSGGPAPEPARANDGAEGQNPKHPGDRIPGGGGQKLGGKQGGDGDLFPSTRRTTPRVGHPRH